MSDKETMYLVDGGDIFYGTLDQFADCFGTVKDVPYEDTIVVMCEINGWSLETEIPEKSIDDQIYVGGNHWLKN